MLAMMLLVMTASVMATNYVSYAGKFYLTYPDDWVQMDYVTVDGFLQQSGAVDRTLFDYEVVLAHKDNSPFFDGPYLLLKLDTSRVYTREMIDSVANELAAEYRTSRAEIPFDEFWDRMAFKVPYVDHERGITVIKLAMGPPREGQKYNVIAVKYYEHGAANFFFYAPRDQFNDNLETFRAIFTSMSTDNWERAAASEPVRVADIDTTVKPDRADSADSRTTLWVLVGIALILVVIIRSYLIRKKRS
jgi:hypothetical protein